MRFYFRDIVFFMTDDELLMECYRKLIFEFDEIISHIKKDNFEWTCGLVEEFIENKQILVDIFSDIKCVDDLKKLDEAEYAFVYEMLNEYAEIFVIDGTSGAEKMRQDEKVFEQLMDLLGRLESSYVPQDWYEDDESCEEDID